MGFSEVLDDLMKDVPGIVGAAVMAEDGLTLETRIVDSGPDVEVVGAELAVVFRNLTRGIEDVNAGDFIEFHASNEKLIYLVRFLTREYFAMLILGPTAILGQARFHLRRAADRLKGEF